MLSAQQLHDELEKVEYDDLAHTKMYVEIAGTHLEIIGLRHKHNGGALFFQLDEVSEQHARARLGNYSDEVHERRAAVK